MSNELEVNQFDHLLEIAHLALDERMIEEAGEIFATLAHARPSNPYPRIGQALIVYGQRKHDDAIALLEGVLRDFPRAIFTRSLLAKIMLEAGRPNWQRHARDALSLASEGVAADMARDLLESHGETTSASKTPTAKHVTSIRTGVRGVSQTQQYQYGRPA